MPPLAAGATRRRKYPERRFTMNKADVLSKVSEKTGIDSAICEKVIEAFEEQAGDALMEKIKGTQTNDSNVLANISAKTGVSSPDCDKILTALGGVVQEGISDKLSVFKKMFSKE
jgi:hypothetical protein